MTDGQRSNIKIILIGALGRMGQAVLKQMDNETDLALVAAFDISQYPNPSVPADEALAQGEVIIDFSAPSGTLSLLPQAVALKKPMVIGTTGFAPEEIQEIARGASAIPIVFSSNMSIGVNVVFHLLSEVTRTLGNAYDIEIVEIHHRNKKDAPSGTALQMGKIIASARGTSLQDAGRFTREGITGTRLSSEIGIQSLRGGDVVGEHTVIFAGLGERVEITHRAHSRDNFARGALLAARWVTRQPPGLYDMRNVLNLA